MGALFQGFFPHASGGGSGLHCPMNGQEEEGAIPFDFSPYRDILGGVDGEITSFETLNRFLEREETDGGASGDGFRRLPLQIMRFDTDWKKIIRHLVWQACPKGGQRQPGWVRIMARRRRKMLLVSLLVAGFMFSLASGTLFPDLDDHEILPCLYAALYLLFTFLATYAFVKMVVGYRLARRGAAGNPCHPAHRAREPGPEERCAILYPVHHEEMHRVGAGMASLIETLSQDVPEKLHHYDLYLLSDSTDVRHVLTEQATLYHLRQRYPGVTVRYRRRAHNANAKLGNVTDFLRRWGRDYACFYVMDADSIVSGACVHQCLEMMAGNPHVGIIQTSPLPVLRQSFFGRLMQFSSHLQGAVFPQAVEALSMGHGSYIGHNAIIRTDAFIKHCLLPDFPGERPWGGRPLSHDTAEAAMMGRAGHEVWFLADVRGSYEELPANLSGFLARENRWMQGNFQNVRFLSADRVQGVHRETLLMGALAYFMAPLSVLFMVSSVYTLAHLEAGMGAEGTGELESVRLAFAGLFVLAMIFLLSPRLIALAVAMRRPVARQYGGRGRLLLSFLLEMLFAFLLNPVLMCFIVKFLLACFRRSSVRWAGQQRDDAPLTFRSCLQDYGWCSALGLAGAWGLVQVLEKQFAYGATLLDHLSEGVLSGEALLVWFLPVIAGLVLAPFTAYLTSRTSALVNRCRWFLIPEEESEPAVIRCLKAALVWLGSCFPPADGAILRHALESPLFYVSHYRQIRHRRAVAERLLPAIRAGHELDRRSLLLALNERACFVALVKAHFRAQGYYGL
ncbi:glucans biosynthesis glucosyltransferase MdoH [Parasaccharibacter apium]|uniref:Glucans biosynthesis glucosyltransferase H n=4 Tax=Acetobacteraceae TaxID=433 RepID=A0ABX4ZRN9_9PROT|nr:glucans biosynthesis glucosyltransferase MdoH [Parasaccharibacter sp. TMW 2.1884]POS62257.1 glucans biosynthesis glucosyltransferase MdoH [Parasaccharibacter apium]POS65065.1 glucans biosynthesis glucosyltransferase MdoH [Parasaccharibacter apium]POS66127.1 glucans biosynthesis glucosyltransferase MdoH [Parasaccharibacter apium]QGT75719.1 glucans biosynthesis glucosyltransferase MdoH [Bombella sp. ESL0368]